MDIQLKYAFEQIRKNNCFYVDKTDFIREWWESMDVVTLIARPRRRVKESFEQIVYNQLDDNEEAIWSLLLASGYLKVLDYRLVDEENGDVPPIYIGFTMDLCWG